LGIRVIFTHSATASGKKKCTTNSYTKQRSLQNINNKRPLKTSRKQVVVVVVVVVVEVVV
jgi:hypothetical protein